MCGYYRSVLIPTRLAGALPNQLQQMFIPVDNLIHILAYVIDLS
jgi:hypothetical protein